MNERETTHCVVGVDPSEGSAGWAIVGLRASVGEWEFIGSGQCRGEAVAAGVLGGLPMPARVKILAVEGIFHGRARDLKVPPPTYWRLGFRSGLIAGELQAVQAFRGAELWVPQPNEWRDAIGDSLGGGRGRRAVMARRVARFASSVAGGDLVGPRGGRQDDRAMAVGIAYAAARRVKW